MSTDKCAICDVTKKEDKTAVFVKKGELTLCTTCDKQIEEHELFVR